MTAEVAVINRVGVALAADSAVTVGPAANKIYTSADKLFQLSTSAPVGVMIYGNANFVSLPWETIVKTFRARLGGDRLQTVEEYGNRLLLYLTNNEELLPPAMQERQVQMLVGSLFDTVRETVRDHLDQEAESRGALEESDLPPLIEKVIKNHLDHVQQSRRIEGFTNDFCERVRHHFSERIGNVKDHIFGQLPLTEQSNQWLLETATDMLTREYFWPLKCGVVVAGFGEREYVPSLISFELEEAVLGMPRKRPGQSYKITESSEACILPFAQQESVRQFMEGIDRPLADFMRETAEGVVSGAIALLLNKLVVIDAQLHQTLETAVKPEVETLLKELFKKWEARQETYWRPILDIVAVLPKDELASMAEALVNLTKFRRRVTPERETVGGPIDVAVITKGDGFVWLRRKHYFDPAFNPRVMARYVQEKQV